MTGPRPLPPAFHGRVGLLLPLALAAAVALSLLVGAEPLRASTLNALLTARGDRTVVGLLVGAAVATSGTLMQGLTRNPLADPGILGVNAGASLAVVIGISAFGLSSLLGYIGFALVGAFAAALAVAALATFGARGVGQTREAGPLAMTLAGMVFTAGATSLAQAVLVSDSKAIDIYRFWQVGSVAGRDAASLCPLAPFFAVGFVVAWFSGRRLDVLAMGDSLARGLGERPGVLRGVIGGVAVLLAAASVAVAGPVAFVGLVAPHLLRPLIGTSYRALVPTCALAGAVLVVAADTLGRVISPPGEVQVGIMTAVLGCPVLLWVVARMRSL